MNNLQTRRLPLERRQYRHLQYLVKPENAHRMHHQSDHLKPDKRTVENTPAWIEFKPRFKPTIVVIQSASYTVNETVQTLSQTKTSRQPDAAICGIAFMRSCEKIAKTSLERPANG